MTAPKKNLDRARARAVRLAAQGLALVPGIPPVQVLERTGWVRTLGGADAYLSLLARQPRYSRSLVDATVAAGQIRVVPAVRGCIYLAPESDVPLCLRIAAAQAVPRVRREHEKVGITPKELAALGNAVCNLLTAKGPMTTDALRKALPEGAVRSLGEAGKKVGISSTLPPALRELEFGRRVDRRPEHGRLDTERYLWHALPKTRADDDLGDDPVRLHARLLERFVRHAGVGSLGAFCAWSGLSQRDARAAAGIADVLPATVEGEDGEAFARQDVDELARMAPAVADAVAFLSFEDNLVHLHGGPHHLVDDEFLDLQVPSWGMTHARKIATTSLRDAPHLSLRPLLADGRISGFWEYDPDAGIAQPHCFRTPSKSAQRRIEELSDTVSAFLRVEVGHGRSFSLDTDDELRFRLSLLRDLAQGRKTRATVRAPMRIPSPGKPKPSKKGAAKPKGKVAAKAAAKSAAKPKARPAPAAKKSTAKKS